jgi:hypothetical protein
LPRRITVFLHGTNTAGFEDVARFTCNMRRSGYSYAASCQNKLGDSFRFGFKVMQKPKPKPKPTGGGGGGIPIQPDLPGDQNCSDFDGPVRVLPGDPDNLDRDGDGIGCE